MTKDMLHLLCIIWAKKAVIMQNDLGYTITLANIDRKVLSVTARPKRIQEFIDVDKFLTLWATHGNLFEAEPPEIAMVYTKMPIGVDDIAHGIPIDLSHPVRNEEGWMFQLKFREQTMPVGHYEEIALFVDWLPTPYCPESIKVIFSELADM